MTDYNQNIYEQTLIKIKILFNMNKNDCVVPDNIEMAPCSLKKTSVDFIILMKLAKDLLHV